MLEQGFKRNRLLAVLCLLIISIPVLCDDSSYRLGPGDVIGISVYGEDELTFEAVRLSDGGTFPYPFFEEVNASGKTVVEVESHLRRLLLGDYLVNPKVSVSVVEYRPFYVNGEVRTPGGYQYKPGLTVRSAVALAGGFTSRASKTKFELIRNTGRAQKRYRAGIDTEIWPGDILTVRQSFF